MMMPLIAMMVMAQAQAQTERTAKPTPPSKADEVVCRRFDVTGSMVRKRKVCYTRAQWAKALDLDQQGARRFVEDNTGRPPGGL